MEKNACSRITRNATTAYWVETGLRSWQRLRLGSLGHPLRCVVRANPSSPAMPDAAASTSLQSLVENQSPDPPILRVERPAPTQESTEDRPSHACCPASEATTKHQSHRRFSITPPTALWSESSLYPDLPCLACLATCKSVGRLPIEKHSDLAVAILRDSAAESLAPTSLARISCWSVLSRLTPSVSHGRQPPATQESTLAETAASRWLHALVGPLPHSSSHAVSR